MARKLAISLLLLGLLVVAGADDASDDTADEAAGSESGPLMPSDFVKTTTLFPDYPDNKIVLGELVDVLCGFSNNGDKSFNITQMRGSLHNAIDYKTIMNLTEANPFAEIKKGEHGTMNYRFFLDPALDPAKYALTLSIDYIDADREEYRTVYFNSTVDLVESASDASSRAFFGRFITIGVLGLVAFLGNNAYKKYSSKKGRRTVDSAAKAASGGANEWLQDVNVPGAKKANSGKKVSGKKN